MALEIISATANDAKAIAQLGRQTFVEAHQSSAPEEELNRYLEEKFNYTALQEELLDSNNIFRLATWENTPIGFSKIIYNSPSDFSEEKQLCKLERLYVMQTHYDKKVGWKLMEHNLNLAQLSKQQGMWLNVWTANTRAIKFYERVGFVIIGGIYFKVGNKYNPNHVMLLRF